MEFFALEGKWADIVFSTVATDRHYLALLLAMRDRYGFKLVVDVDDDVLATHTEPNNPAYTAYLNQGERFAEYFQYCVKEADLVTVSTEYLKKRVLAITDKVVVNPNCINVKQFPKNEETELTIGYAGSGSHQKDWEMIEPQLHRLRDKAKLKLLGPMQADVDEQTKWVSGLEYPGTLAQMGFSIGLAPLKDSLMNRAKSNLRWLEYSALGIPTVASDVVPFRGVENIIKVSEPEEWYEELNHLLEDKDYRTGLGQKAHNELRDYYDPIAWGAKLHDQLRQL